MNNNKKSVIGFWVTNISNKNICLSDLALTIPAWRSFNLLDNRHFHYTIDQLQHSITTGSLFLKKDKFRFSKTGPEPRNTNNLLVSEGTRITTPRSVLKIEEKHYPELPGSDEKFADEFSDLEDST